MDFMLQIDNRTGLAAMTADETETIMNNVYLSIMVEQGSFFYDPQFGSKLHLLKREKNTDRTARLAEDYCREALQWLLDQGKTTQNDVYAERDLTQNINRLKLLVQVTPIAGPPVQFQTFIPVV
jgi:phage gp46-like protein